MKLIGALLFAAELQRSLGAERDPRDFGCEAGELRANGYKCDGGKITSLTLEDSVYACRKRCHKLKNCLGFQFDRDGSHCFLFSILPHDIGAHQDGSICEIMPRTCLGRETRSSSSRRRAQQENNSVPVTKEGHQVVDRKGEQKFMAVAQEELEEKMTLDPFCEDRQEVASHCETWANRGDCEQHPTYMKGMCPKTCNACEVAKMVTLEHLEGEGEGEGEGEQLINPKASTKLSIGCKLGLYANIAPRFGNVACGEEKEQEEQVIIKPEFEHVEGLDKQQDNAVEEGIEMRPPNDASVQPNAPTLDPPCEDKAMHCELWASRGECEQNPSYMRGVCPKTCNNCQSEQAQESACMQCTDEPSDEMLETGEACFSPWVDWRFCSDWNKSGKDFCQYTCWYRWNQGHDDTPCCEEYAPYYPGNLVIEKEGIMLSEGLDVRTIARAFHKVDLLNGTKSDEPFHEKPDYGACISILDDEENPGGWVYLSNSEVDYGNGGVGRFVFNKDGDVIEFGTALNGTTRNCGGKLNFMCLPLRCILILS